MKIVPILIGAMVGAIAGIGVVGGGLGVVVGVIVGGGLGFVGGVRAATQGSSERNMLIGAAVGAIAGVIVGGGIDAMLSASGVVVGLGASGIGGIAVGAILGALVGSVVGDSSRASAP